MAKYNGPKNRRARRIGMDLGLKTPGSRARFSLDKRLEKVASGRGAGRKKISDFGIQLREKQKVKFIYGLLERQLRRFYQQAKQTKGNTGSELISLLERRLDNVIYRLHIAPTRSAARQLVGHGHILIDGKKVDIPSFIVKAGNTITLRSKALEVPYIKKRMQEKIDRMPAWIERTDVGGKIVRSPERADVTEDINEQLVIELYSR